MYPVWVGFGPVHLANELGYFKDEGIRSRRSSTTTCRTASPPWSAATSTATCARSASIRASAARKETQGIIIGTIDLSTGGDGWAADESIKSVCDLKGKTIAVEPNLPARLIMQMALKKDCNLSIKDTNLTDIAAADAIGVFADTERRRGRHLRAGAQPGGRGASGRAAPTSWPRPRTTRT